MEHTYDFEGWAEPGLGRAGAQLLLQFGNTTLSTCYFLLLLSHQSYFVGICSKKCF